MNRRKDKKIYKKSRETQRAKKYRKKTYNRTKKKSKRNIKKTRKRTYVKNTIGGWWFGKKDCARLTDERLFQHILNIKENNHMLGYSSIYYIILNEELSLELGIKYYAIRYSNFKDLLKELIYNFENVYWYEGPERTALINSLRVLVLPKRTDCNARATFINDLFSEIYDFLNKLKAKETPNNMKLVYKFIHRSLDPWGSWATHPRL